MDTILYFECVLSAKSLPKWTSNYCIWWVAKWQRCWIIFWTDTVSMTIIDDDGWLLSPDQWIQGIQYTLRDCSDVIKILLISWDFTSEKFTITMTLRYCTWINTELHLVDILLFYDGCQTFKGLLACCLMNMLLCYYLIPKECGDSKVLFSKLKLTTYIYSIHYIFPFEFILGYIVRRLIIII